MLKVKLFLVYCSKSNSRIRRRQSCGLQTKGEDLQNAGLCLAPTAIEKEGIMISSPPVLTWDLHFCFIVRPNLVTFKVFIDSQKIFQSSKTLLNKESNQDSLLIFNRSKSKKKIYREILEQINMTSLSKHRSLWTKYI